MIILMGLAGSGKSTQGQILAEKLGRTWLSAGQVLREYQEKDPELKQIMDRGDLVDDTKTIPIMRDKMAEILARGEDVILDGYPRTVTQSEWMANNAADRTECVLYIDVPKSELVQRMKLRGRSDDLDGAAITERFRVVEQNIYTVTEMMKAKNIPVVVVDGTGTVEQVAARIDELIKKFIQH